MEINVGLYRKDDNKQVARSIVVRVDLEENEIIAIDEDFQARWVEQIKPLVELEIEGTKELDS